MPTTTGQISQLLAPGLRKIFFQHLKERPTRYSKIFNMNTSSRAYEEDLEFVGLGTMPQKPEGNSIQYQDPTQGAKKRYTHISFGLGFRVTVEAYEDDLYGPMKRMTRELAKAGRNVREVRSFNVLNNAFTTEFGFPKFGANEPLISTAHTLIGGGTQANRAAVDADLGVASLEAAILLFDNLVEEEASIPIVIKPKHLIIPSALKQVAREILGSEFRPYTANNEVNAIIQNDSITDMVVHYLADSDSWFLLADKDEHDLNFFERAAIRFQNGDDFDTGDAKFKAFQRFSVGAGEWRGIFGSLGA
jgi:phage major head subunit gpT-like protein